MSQVNQSLKNEAWSGQSGPYSHITPILGGDRVAWNYMNGTALTGATYQNGQYVGIGNVLGEDVAMATIDGGYSILGINIPHTTTMLNVYNNANYDDIEGWAPRIFLTDASSSNGGLSSGKLNQPWSSSLAGKTRPFSWQADLSFTHGSTGYGFTLKNLGANVAMTAYGYNAVSTPYLNTCAYRNFFSGVSDVNGIVPRLIWKVKVRCTRFYENDLDWVQENYPYLYDDDQGTSSVRVLLFATDADGAYNGSGLANPPFLIPGAPAVPAGNTTHTGGGKSADDPANNSQATYYYSVPTEVPFLYQGYEGDQNDYASAVNILGLVPGSEFIDGVPSGYSYRGSNGQRYTVSAPQHQAQYDALQEQTHNTGWTEIEFYCEFSCQSTAMDGLQIAIDNQTPNTTILVDYVSLQPLNISPENLYAYRNYGQWGESDAIFSNGKGFNFTLGYPGVRTGAYGFGYGLFSNFGFDQYLDP